jgi:hypothetical protein
MIHASAAVAKNTKTAMVQWVNEWGPAVRCRSSFLIIYYGGRTNSRENLTVPSQELWKTNSALPKLKRSFIKAMKDKISLVGAQTVLHQGYERQNQSCRGSNCPSSGLWKTKSVLPGLKLSFKSVMKDKISLVGAQTVLHQGYERQNQSCWGSNCLSSRLWKTKSVLSGSNCLSLGN